MMASICPRGIRCGSGRAVAACWSLMCSVLCFMRISRIIINFIIIIVIIIIFVVVIAAVVSTTATAAAAATTATTTTTTTTTCLTCDLAVPSDSGYRKHHR